MVNHNKIPDLTSIFHTMHSKNVIFSKNSQIEGKHNKTANYFLIIILINFLLIKMANVVTF